MYITAICFSKTYTSIEHYCRPSSNLIKIIYISNFAHLGSYAPSQGVCICTQTFGSFLPVVPLIQIQTEVKSHLLPSPRDPQNQNMGLWKQGSEMEL